MPFSRLLACPAQCHTLVQGYVIPDDGRLPDDHAAAVVDEQSFADLRSRMDLDPGLPGCALGDHPR